MVCSLDLGDIGRIGLRRSRIFRRNPLWISHSKMCLVHNISKQNGGFVADARANHSAVEPKGEVADEPSAVRRDPYHFCR